MINPSSFSDEVRAAPIVLLDHDLTTAPSLSAILRANGHTNIHIINGSSQLDHICARHLPDLIIMDLGTHRADALAILTKVKQSSHGMDIPVIAIAEPSDRTTGALALHVGARDLLIRPFDGIEAICRIRNTLETRLLHKRLNRERDAQAREAENCAAEVIQTRVKIIQRLSRAAEFRDNETGMHIMRMSLYSHLLAQTMGLDQDDCRTILHASPLHDIGKIGIPDNILLKPGKLTKHEWEIMKSHTTIGARILDDDSCPLLATAKTIALTHHERWDGQGYPQGLKGKAIPLAGRIVAIADVFDALTSPRPYKAAWQIDKTVNYLASRAGTQFDPDLVHAFLEVLPEALQIKERYAENCDNPDVESGQNPKSLKGS